MYRQWRSWMRWTDSRRIEKATELSFFTSCRKSHQQSLICKRNYFIVCDFSQRRIPGIKTLIHEVNQPWFVYETLWLYALNIQKIIRLREPSSGGRNICLEMDFDQHVIRSKPYRVDITHCAGVVLIIMSWYCIAMSCMHTFLGVINRRSVRSSLKSSIVKIFSILRNFLSYLVFAFRPKNSSFNCICSAMYHLEPQMHDVFTFRLTL